MKKVNFILLAGGKGSRMKTTIPKVLYPINDGLSRDSSFQRIINLINSIEGIEKKIYAVISSEINENLEFKKQIPSNIFSIVQEEKKGTGHAVQIVSQYLDKSFDNTIIIYCDHPLITKNTIYSTLESLEWHLLCCLCFFKEEQNNYGKCILSDTLNKDEKFIIDNINNQNKNNFLLQTISITNILEQKDIKDQNTYLKFCNAGVNVKTDVLLRNINNLPISDSTNEIYLTKIVELIEKNETLTHLPSKCVGLIVPEEELIAFNSLEELRLVEDIMQNSCLS